MNIRVTKFETLTHDEIAIWSEIQRLETSLDSPYFRPEFTRAVAGVRNDVEVAVLEESGIPVGFLPFQRSSWNAGRPIGGGLSDFHGLVARSGITCDPLELLRACGLSTWHFSHLVAGQTWLAPYVRHVAHSPYICIPDGMDAYVQLRASGRCFMARYGQKKRKLAREIGPVQCEFHQPDPAILDMCIYWKREQYWRTSELDIFGFSWIRNLLTNLLEYVGEDFSAVVSVLRAGDRIAAIHFGMRSQGVFHSWFPTYNVELAKYSPGFLHWVELMKSAQAHGIRRIDLSKGQEGFKRRIQSGAARVAEGTVDAQIGTAVLRQVFLSARDRLRDSPLGAPVRTPARIVRRITHWLNVR